jgi:hypothetical protein
MLSLFSQFIGSRGMRILSKMLKAQITSIYGLDPLNMSGSYQPLKPVFTWFTGLFVLKHRSLSTHTAGGCVLLDSLYIYI